MRELEATANEFAIAGLRADKPARSSEIIVGLGDRIQLVPTYNTDLAVQVIVDRDGTALFPVVGHLQVYGLSRAELETLLRREYSPYYETLDLHALVSSD